ncbi:MAG: flagellar filament capping protein FliD, partial [Rickettsiales bacterium]|nr:flagellar filament capping protein FliD [Rickettsiales bacterium]
NADANNIFEYRTSSLSINTSNTASNYLSVITAAGADLGEFDIAIEQLAKAKTLRTDAFTSKTSSVVETAGGTTSGLFSAGAFGFAPPVATDIEVTTDGDDALASADYTVEGTATGTVITAAGIHDITDDDDDGDTALMGTISSFNGNYDSGANTLIITVTVNGQSYVSNAIATDAGGSSDSIASGQDITFTNSSTGTSFVLTTGASDYLIDSDSNNAVQFVTDIKNAIASQSIYQARTLGIFNDDDVTGQLAGLTSADVTLYSDGFSTLDDTHGDLEGFTVTHNGVDNNDISVVIDGETYQATGLADSYGSNLVLASTTTDKELRINLNDAGVTLDLSSAGNATAVQDALDYAFGAKQLTNITLQSGDTLVDVAARINAVTASSNVKASIIQVSDTDFRLTVESTVEGTNSAFVIVDDNGVTDEVTFNTIQSAQNSSFSIDDIALTRQTNSVTDAISGLTLNLVKETSDFDGPSEEIITVNVTNDNDTAK